MGELPSHDAGEMPLMLIPYFKPGTTQPPVPSNATYPDPSPNDADTKYIELLRRTKFQPITMAMWNEIRKGEGIQRTFTYHPRRHLKGTDVGSVRNPIQIVKCDTDLPNKYVRAAQKLFDTYFTTMFATHPQTCTFGVMEKSDEKYQGYIRGYFGVDPKLGEYIRIHPEFLYNTNDRCILNLLLHEISHALRSRIDRTFQIRGGHDWIWQRICLNIGGDGWPTDSAFDKPESTRTPACVYTCKSTDKTVCVFRISKYDAPYEYDDSYTQIVDAETGCCAQHGTTFQREPSKGLPPKLAQPVDVEISKSRSDGIVTIVKDDAMFKYSKSATSSLVTNISSHLSHLKTSEDGKRQRTDMDDDVSKFKAEINKHIDSFNKSTTIRELYGHKVIIDELCKRFIISHTDKETRNKLIQTYANMMNYLLLPTKE